VAELLGRRLARHLPLLDPIAEAVQPRVRAALDANPRLRDVLDGEWLGTPLHPPLTDVPIGAGTVAVLFDAAETLTGSPAMARAADLSLALGVLGALPAATTGVTEWRDLRDEPRRIGVGHALLNGSALVLNVASLGLRASGRRGAGKAAAGVAYGLQAAAAHVGGELAFRLGVGVRGPDVAVDARPVPATAGD
jgi:uncharacterized membrane protein